MSDQSKIQNFLGMARSAELGGNQEEAIEYYNRVLEIDPTIADAWFGKGKAAAWQSNLNNFRISEAIIAFNHSIANTEPETEEVRRQQAVDEVNQIVNALYSMARNNLEEFASLDNTWPSYVDQVAQMTDALESARAWLPNDRITLENIVHLCKDNIEGFSFRDEYNDGMPGAYTLSDEYEALLRSQMDAAIATLQEIDDSYAPPVIQKKEADACFVVTATMGDFDHPHVTQLRQFRDNWLVKQAWAKVAVHYYYLRGPFFAKFIARSRILRTISYLFLVKPAVFLTSFLNSK